jgi:flagellar assembly protein FliH
VLLAGEVPSGAGQFNLASFERHARELLARAERRAAEIVAEAELRAAQQAEQASRAGRDAGLAEGLQLGREEGARVGREQGLGACREETATLAETLRALVAELAARRAALIKEAEEDLLALSVRVAERIVRRQVELDDRVALRAVAEAVGLAAERSRVQVRLNPADLAALDAAREDLARQFAEVQELRLVGDALIPRGGCLVVTGAGEVDMRLETQLERVGRALAGRPEGDGGAAGGGRA